jgi:8-oxo-dGTP pyrophosphatase MutT (NUDIX family)
MLSSQKITQETQTDLSGDLDLSTLLTEKGINAPAELIALIVEVVKKVPSLNEATIVNLANHLKITMFGSEVSDKLTTIPGRKLYNLHPYRKAGSGAVCMATYSDNLNQTYVLLGQKKPRGPAHDTRYILLGGYFQPYPLTGHIEGLEKLTQEEKDEIEEAIRYGLLNAYKKMAREEKEETPSSKEPLNLAAAKAPPFDLNVEACASRELREETGLSQIKPQFLMEQSSYPLTNPDLHSINLSYLFDCGNSALPPETKPGSDIGKLQWVKLSAINVSKADGVFNYSLNEGPIRQDHGPILEKGARVLINQQIKKQSEGLLTLSTLERTLEVAANKVHKPMTALLGNKPDTFLGAEAGLYYNKLVKLATEYSSCLAQNAAFNYARIEACLKDKKPSPIKTLSTWCGVFAAASTVALAAYHLYPSTKSPAGPKL